MRISNLTDQAVVLMQAAASRCGGQRVRASDLALATGVPVPTAQKLVSQLTRAGLLKSVRGSGGGIRLARPASAITLADVVEALEGPIALTACSAPEATQDCHREEACAMRPHWDPVNHAVRGALASISLASLAKPRAEEVTR